MAKGWIKIFRELQDHWIWNNAEYLKAWIDILLTANREESKTLIDNKVVTMPEGSIVTSEVKLAARWGWSRKKVRNFLSCLESDQMLVIKRDSRGTALTVVNWAKFQGKGTAKGTAKEQPRNSRGYSSGTPNKKESTYVDSKEVEEVENNSARARTRETPPPAAVDQVIAAWNRIPHTQDVSGIVPGTRRWDELQICFRMYGAADVMKAIDKIADSTYLRNKGDVRFDNYISRDQVPKVLEGAYDRDYSAPKERKRGSEVDWK